VAGVDLPGETGHNTIAAIATDTGVTPYASSTAPKKTLTVIK
jgi:hypothetical protein